MFQFQRQEGVAHQGCLGLVEEWGPAGWWWWQASSFWLLQRPRYRGSAGDGPQNVLGSDGNWLHYEGRHYQKCNSQCPVSSPWTFQAIHAWCWSIGCLDYIDRHSNWCCHRWPGGRGEGLSFFFSLMSSLMLIDNLGNCKDKDEQDDCDWVPPLCKIVPPSLNLDGNNGYKSSYGEDAHTDWFCLNLKFDSKD